MIRKLVYTVVFGSAALVFAAYGVRNDSSAPSSGAVHRAGCLDKNDQGRLDKGDGRLDKSENGRLDKTESGRLGGGLLH